METREKQQRRAFKTEFETREAEDGKKYISGYFVVFNQETELWPGAYESIDPDNYIWHIITFHEFLFRLSGLRKILNQNS